MTPIDFKNLEKMIAERYINVQRHPQYDLFIYNYSHKTQYDAMWDNETLQCRGLIMDRQKNIVARGFPKFFNLSELIPKGFQIPDDVFVVTEKLDGSLGILYQVDKQPFIATRGSFTSDQAIAANRILKEKYSHVKFEPNLTYLFEIILPTNRIVVDYGGIEDLYLLAVIRTNNGDELSYSYAKTFSEQFGFPLVKRYDGLEDAAKIENMHLEVGDNAEGFVIQFPSTGQRVKIKSDEYRRLHRLLTGVNAKTIWDLLRHHQSIDELLERVPDEFFVWVKNTIADLKEKYLEIELEAARDFHLINDNLEDSDSKKEFALKALKTKYPHVLFALHDSKDPDERIWKMIRPVAEKPFKVEI